MMKKANLKLLLAALLLSTSALAGCLDEDAAIGGEDTEQSSPLRAREQHCTLELTAQRQGEPAPEVSKAPTTRCYDSFSNAIFAATRGGVRLPSDATPERLDAEQITALAPSVRAIEYIAPQWDGFWGSYTFTSSVTCDQGYIFPVNDLAPYWINITALNNAISSALTMPGCLHGYHYDLPYLGGSLIDCPSSPAHNCYYSMGAMNDRTSSILWTN